MEQVPTAVQRFLDGLQTGDWAGMEQHLTPDSRHDGSMPFWRTRYSGPERIVRAYREEWTAKGTWRLPQPVVTQTDDTVIVELEGTMMGAEEKLLCRIANVFALRDGRIAEHRYYCCGEWSEQVVREIEAEAPRFDGEAVSS